EVRRAQRLGGALGEAAVQLGPDEDVGAPGEQAERLGKRVGGDVARRQRPVGEDDVEAVAPHHFLDLQAGAGLVAAVLHRADQPPAARAGAVRIGRVLLVDDGQAHLRHELRQLRRAMEERQQRHRVPRRPELRQQPVVVDVEDVGQVEDVHEAERRPEDLITSRSTSSTTLKARAIAQPSRADSTKAGASTRNARSRESTGGKCGAAAPHAAYTATSGTARTAGLMRAFPTYSLQWNSRNRRNPLMNTI